MSSNRINHQRQKNRPHTHTPTNKNRQPNNHNLSSAKYYQYSSEAYEVVPEEEAETRTVRQRKTKKLSRKERSKLIRKRNAPKYVYEEQPERKISFFMIFSTLTICVCVFAYVLTFGIVALANNDLLVLESELEGHIQKNEAMKSALIDSYDLKDIEQKAVKGLGMVKPGEHQIIYITVPKQSYFVQYNNTEEADESGFFLQDIFGFLSGNSSE